MGLKIFSMNEYDWVVAESKQQAIDWYGREFGDEETEDCWEIRYNQKFWLDLSDESRGKRTAKWFLGNHKYDIPSVIFSTEY